MSISIFDKLLIRGFDLFNGKLFEQGEPLVSTFAREMVDNQNNTVMTSAQAKALVNAGPSTGLRMGTWPIPSGVDLVTVTGLGLAVAPMGVQPGVMRLTGASNIGANVLRDTITTDGFVVSLTGITDSDQYVLTFIHN